jgi:hypothetical protein
MNLVRITITNLYDEVVELENSKLSNEKILKRYLNKKEHEGYDKFLSKITECYFFDDVRWATYFYTIERNIKIIRI